MGDNSMFYDEPKKFSTAITITVVDKFSGAVKEMAKSVADFEKAKEIVSKIASPVVLPDTKNITKPFMNILSLDIATKTGWCTRTASGEWNLTPRKNESAGMRLIKFKSSLKDICSAEEIKIIVFEGAVSYSKFPNHVAVELQGVLKLFCEENGIQYKSYMPTEIKKSATGKGNAKKPDMIAAAVKYKPSVTSDNEADAIHLYWLAIKDLNL